MKGLAEYTHWGVECTEGSTTSCSDPCVHLNVNSDVGANEPWINSDENR